MLSSVRLLTNVASVNLFTVVPVLDLQVGSSPATVYIQLWQKDLNERYIPQAGGSTTVTVEFLRSDTVGVTPTSQTVSKSATLAYSADDRSIWKVTLSSADLAKVVSGGYRVTVVETIDSVVTTNVMFITNAIRRVSSSGDTE